MKVRDNYCGDCSFKWTGDVASERASNIRRVHRTVCPKCGGTRIVGGKAKDAVPRVRIEVRIGAKGGVSGMYSDELLPLAKAMGRVAITRASHVEFDDAAQAWGVWDAKGRDTGKRFVSRADALGWERDHFWSLVGGHDR